MDTRALAYVVWGLGTLAIYGIVLWRRRRDWMRRRDRRASRDLAEAIAEFLVSLAASLSIFLVLLFGGVGGIGGLLVVIALGAFFAAGIIKITDNPTERPQ